MVISKCEDYGFFVLGLHGSSHGGFFRALHSHMDLTSKPVA